MRYSLSATHPFTRNRDTKPGERVQKARITSGMEKPEKAEALADDALRKSEEQFRALVIASIDAIYQISADWSIINRLTGSNLNTERKADSLGWIDEYIYPDDRQLIKSAINEAIRTRKGFETEYRCYHNNTISWRFLKAIPVLDENNEVTEWFGTVKDINARKKAEELRLNNEALKKSVQMKDEFLSLISHEFRTPLTVINSAVQALEFICRDELSIKAKGFIKKIKQNSNRQLKLVNNLLDITRINAGYLKIHKTNKDIVRVTEAIIYSIKVYAEQKGISLKFSSTMKKKIIGIDEDKYERIILNLLSNAIKFTPKGKFVSVRVFQKLFQRKRKVCIEVSDDGIGIPDEKKELIFERFGQVDSLLTRQAEGTGIGLSLVKMLVELLGGNITLYSKEGEGSKFTVILPAERAEEVQTQQDEIMSDSRLIQATALEFSDISF